MTEQFVFIWTVNMKCPIQVTVQGTLKLNCNMFAISESLPVCLPVGKIINTDTW